MMKLQRRVKISLFVLVIALLTLTRAAGQNSAVREMRAAWIATVLNIDWPSKKGLSSLSQKEEFVRLLDTLKSVGMNAVIVQVRPTADAFYPSSYEPWSEYLSGQQGVPPEPYYNPLAFMIEETRKRGLEFHAWFNPYRASMKVDFVPGSNHPFLSHRDWFLEYGGKWYYDPGHPEAREFVLRSILETVKHYDLDAIHFDDYFYPYRIAGKEFPDDSTYHKYGKNTYSVRDDWRRNNVDYFVSELSRRIREEKPHVKFGISPFGVWRNRDKDELGSDTQAGQTNYDDLFADVLKWLREGWIDYVTPQIYWHIGFEKADYKTLATWWSRNSYGRHVYIGQGIYRIGEKGWEDPNEIINQISFNRNDPGISGSMYFSSKVFIENRKGINKKIDSVYRRKALLPLMDWKPGAPPPPPVPKGLSGSPSVGLVLEWSDSTSANTAAYAIYRYNGGAIRDTDRADALVDIVPREASGTQQWKDTSIKKQSTYTYVITGLDRLHHESEPGKAVVVKTRGKRKRVSAL